MKSWFNKWACDNMANSVQYGGKSMVNHIVKKGNRV